MTTTSKGATQQEEEEEEPRPPLNNERLVRPSIAIRMIRHAESRNNEVYRNARYIYRGGTPDFDEAGWTAYVAEHRQADPGLSQIGVRQAERLAEYLVPHLLNQAQHPVGILVSPMRRTCETIRPTLARLLLSQTNQTTTTQAAPCKVTVHGFYFESEGCHTNQVPEEGMNPAEIAQVLYHPNNNNNSGATTTQTTTPAPATAPTDFVGFPSRDPARGWWCEGTGPETRAESEQRAAKFYLWLCEHLDHQLQRARDDDDDDDGDSGRQCTIHDAGVALPGEEHENEHDHAAVRLRRRRTQLLIGHGDFMGLVLKRIVAGFGHAVETVGVPHRSAFVHWNTGITELEYFGRGRFLLMGHNGTPHLAGQPGLLSGGSLKDGWSYLMPSDAVLLNAEVSVAFSDEELDDHVLEQKDALKALYLSSRESETLSAALNGGTDLSVEEKERAADKKGPIKHFIVKRGLQVVGVATYSETTGLLSDVAVRPSAGKEGTEALFNAVKEHSRKLGRSGSLLVLPRTRESKQLFEAVGFGEVHDENSEHMEFRIDGSID